MGAVLRGRDDEVFAAAQRPDGVNGAALFFEERARDSEGEVAKTEGVGAVFV